MTAKTDPIPTRFDREEDEMIRRINKATGMPYAEIVRRCCRFALPKFENGTANIALYSKPVAGRAKVKY